MNIRPTIGEGIYNIPEAARILNIPTQKVGLWIRKYWELEFLRSTQGKKNIYTWGETRDRGFNFYTLIELIAVKSFRDIGLSFKKIKLAHEILSTVLDTPYPFANSILLSDGRTIFLDQENADLLGIDNKLQYSFKEIVSPYCKKLEFNSKTNLAKRFWPLGKDKSIIIDPHHSFGQPVVLGTNITTYSILKYLQAGESKEFVAKIFEIKTKMIDDVIQFGQRIAA